MTHTESPLSAASEERETRPDIAEIALRDGVPVLDLVVPVYNEEKDLESSVRRLHAYLSRKLPYRYRITIADNASIDRTPKIAQRLAQELHEVTSTRLEQKGRGRALHAVWSASDAPVLAYLDVDLSTDLDALGPLIAPLVSGHSDLAIGSRLSRSSNVVRGAKREFISRCYNLLLRGTLSARFSDAQCGFKAIRADVARRLLPMVADTGWFFDTELLVLAERSGLRIHEVPVDWVDDPDSRVDIVATALADLKGMWRLTRSFASGRLPLDRIAGRFGRQRATEGVPPSLLRQLVRFSCIGVLSTAAYLVLYLIFRAGMNAQIANFLALLLTAIANTAANRRLTFRVRGRANLGRHQFEGLMVFALGFALTSGALWALHHYTHPSQTTELAVLVLANLVATVLRFVLLRGWVFHPRRQRSA
ncbi:bifunctional glycosyltransferase family 2/GtrA family protein [Sciscionella marina]|uniref:bifunctional glycosyltransferase family 2/GtrA family protein n=1 Tax=Sciscionella marina TaxID=508770 RepID=UPI00037BB103|nr:bifunctional glycosyltransferase family 2/GtrA family protein [Sciscionella marina]